MYLPIFEVVNAQVFSLSAQKHYTLARIPGGVNCFVIAALRCNFKDRTVGFTGVFFFPLKINRPGKRANIYPALPKERISFQMAQSNIPQPAQNGQTLADSPATPLQIQKRLTALRRQLCDSDALVLRIFAERLELQAEITAETVRYQDALNAGMLREQGAEAVSEVEAMLSKGQEQ
jgi:hypothetical protein